MPVFTLAAQEGRLFKPLALTKNLAIAVSAVLSVTLIPALLSIFIRGRILPEERHSISRWLVRLYAPALAAALRYRKSLVILSVLLKSPSQNLKVDCHRLLPGYIAGAFVLRRAGRSAGVGASSPRACHDVIGAGGKAGHNAGRPRANSSPLGAQGKQIAQERPLPRTPCGNLRQDRQSHGRRFRPPLPRDRPKPQGSSRSDDLSRLSSKFNAALNVPPWVLQKPKKLSDF